MYKNINDKHLIYTPDQPFYIASSTRYLKYSIKKYGLSHFYAFYSLDEVHVSNIVPDGCIDITFCCNNNSPYAYTRGTVLRARAPKAAHFKKHNYYFGVRFLPGWRPALLKNDISMCELLEQELPFSYVVQNSGITDNIIRSRDFFKQMQVFMSYYMPMYFSSDEQSVSCRKRLARYVRRSILCSNESHCIQRIASEAGVSVRYINLAFNEEFGISPKLFSSLVRFQQCLININHGNGNSFLREIASKSGYYDQSHMTKEFLSFMDISPKQYQVFLRDTDFSSRLIVHHNDNKPNELASEFNNLLHNIS